MGQTLHKIRLTNPGEDITAIAVTKYGCISNYSSLMKHTDQVKKYIVFHMLYT